MEEITRPQNHHQGGHMKKSTALIHFSTVAGLMILINSLPLLARDSTETALLIHEQKNTPVVIEGTLSCQMGEQNTGQPCELKILDKESGRSFVLVNSNTALKVYHEGIRDIKVKGFFEDYQTFRIKDVLSI